MAAVMRNPAGTKVGWEFIKQHWTDINKKLSDALQLSLVKATDAICDGQQRDEVQRFFGEHPVPGSDRDLAQALEKISICIDARSIQVKNLTDRLNTK